MNYGLYWVTVWHQCSGGIHWALLFSDNFAAKDSWKRYGCHRRLMNEVWMPQKTHKLWFIGHCVASVDRLYPTSLFCFSNSFARKDPWTTFWESQWHQLPTPRQKMLCWTALLQVIFKVQHYIDAAGHQAMLSRLLHLPHFPSLHPFPPDVSACRQQWLLWKAGTGTSVAW